MAMHIEQPASRHSAPASLKTSSSPSASACCLTSCEPGTTSIAHARRDLAPLEQARRQPQIGDARVGAAADEHHVDLVAEQRLAGLEIHVRERLFERGPLVAVGDRRRDPACGR